MIYSGSIERIDFGEEHEPKGWVVATVQRGRTEWQFHKHYNRPARPFITIAVDVRKEEGDPTPAVVEAIGKHDLTDAVVRVVLQLRAEQETLLQEREVLRALQGRLLHRRHRQGHRAGGAAAPRRDLGRVVAAGRSCWRAISRSGT